VAIVTAVDLVNALRQSSILERDQLEEAARELQARFPEPRALAGELLQRGWLTPYQVKRLLRDDGRSLVLPPYVVLERLGEGGTGKVFKARHQRLQRVVALKVIRPELLADADVVNRFQREIQVASRVSHPNVVHAYDAGDIGGVQTLVLEYIEGVSLDRLVKQSGPLPPAVACDYMRQAALGLQHIHECGLVHRDIKPSNLLLQNAQPGLGTSTICKPQAAIVKILDLGLARLQKRARESQQSATITSEGTLTMGTPDYMAPEQAIDFHRADIRADVYSLGCTFYFLLTGQPPFPDGFLTEKLMRHQQAEPPPLAKLRPGLPPGLEQVVRKMLAKKPGDRYQMPGEVAQALAHIDTSAPVRMPAPAATGRGRPRIALLLGMAALLLAVPLAWWLRTASARKPSISLLSPATAGQTLEKVKHTENRIGMKLAPIPPGELTIGASREAVERLPLPDWARLEGPPHQVKITKGFFMGAYPVTVGQFRKFIEDSGHKPATRDGKDWRNPGTEQTDEHPVVLVSWRDADAFCKWLGKKEGKTYRLPTEAEWEHACRAGSKTAYHFGDDAKELEKHGWFDGNSQGKRHPVGQLLPNQWGLYDMHGNVYQWTADWYDADYYKNSPEADPRGPAAGITKVMRGGEYSYPAWACRSAARKARTPDHITARTGFRVVCEQ